MKEKIKAITLEDYIWYTYIFIALFALLSNYYEKRFYKFKCFKDRNTYKKINITILIIAIIIYIYFIYRNIKKDKHNITYYLSLFASLMFFIGGLLYLYTEIYSYNNIELGI